MTIKIAVAVLAVLTVVQAAHNVSEMMPQAEPHSAAVEAE